MIERYGQIAAEELAGYLARLASTHALAAYWRNVANVLRGATIDLCPTCDAATCVRCGQCPDHDPFPCLVCSCSR